MARFSGVSEDFAVLGDDDYRGNYLVLGPLEESVIIWRFTTPLEEAAIERHGAASLSLQSVYFIQAGEDGPVKIGISLDPEKRKNALQTGSAEKLQLLATAFGGKAAEAALHTRFKHLRLQGEWFRPEAELLRFVTTLVGGLL